MAWGEPNPELEERYADGWAELSRDTKRSQQVGDRVRCSCCGELHDWDEIQTHHAYYLGEGDTAGLNVFPVCGNTSEAGTCHHWLHLKEQWYRDPHDPTWQSGNYPDVVLRLRRGYEGVPHIVPYDFDWQVLARVGGGIAAVVIGVVIAANWDTALKEVGQPAGLSAEQSPAANLNRIYTVAAPAPYNSLTLRDRPNGTATGYALPNGAQVKVIEVKGNWAKVKGGWVWLDWLK